MLSIRVMLRAQKAQILGIRIQRITTSNSLSSSDHPSDSNDHLTKDPKKVQSKEERNVESDENNAENVLNNVMNAKPVKHNINISVTARTSKVSTNEKEDFEEKLSAAAKEISQYYRSHVNNPGQSIARELQQKYINATRSHKRMQRMGAGQFKGEHGDSEFGKKLSGTNERTGNSNESDVRNQEPSILRELQESYNRSQRKSKQWNQRIGETGVHQSKGTHDASEFGKKLSATNERTGGSNESNVRNQEPSILRELQESYYRSQRQKNFERKSEKDYQKIQETSARQFEGNYDAAEFGRKLSTSNERTGQSNELNIRKEEPSILRQLQESYNRSQTQENLEKHSEEGNQRTHDASDSQIKEKTYNQQGPSSHVRQLLKQYLKERNEDDIKDPMQNSLKNKHQNAYKSLYKNTEYEISFFEQMQEQSAAPQLKTWDLLEKKALRVAITLYPSNALEEMIQWTSQGKLWRFPIDNEQGIEKEHNVHFSEHVFMDRHLQGWCPNNGPVRHFMELVCVGLSKNAYMTVEEKVEHIMWYKNYFAEKQSLLDTEINEPPSDEASNVVV